MRILSLDEFRAMPEGTFFKQASVPYSFGDWQIKGETWEHDFIATTTDWPENEGSDSLFDALGVMWDDSRESRPLAWSYGRDGLFEKDAKFLILEAKDLSLLRDAVDFALTQAHSEKVE